MKARVDHLIVGTPDLDAGVRAVERRLGVTPAPGGAHAEWGTRNALLSLGPGTYLEIMGPDPEYRGTARPLWGIADFREPRLVAWCAAVEEGGLPEVAAAARAAGIPLGDVRSGERAQPDGTRLTWRFTAPETPVAGGVIPFFIDWGGTPHPSGSAPAGGTLEALRAEHPEAEEVRSALEILGLGHVRVSTGPEPALIARIAGSAGTVELR